MAKTVGPLLSLNAHGSLAKTLAYSSKRTGKQVRRYNKPLATPTPTQREQRRLTEFLVAQWQHMSDADKATWATNARASGLDLPAYHYFLREAQRNLYVHHGLCAYWSFNKIVGGQVLDRSGNANHGTLEDNYPTTAPTLITSLNTRFSNALYFAGTNPYVSVAPAASLRPDAITFELWFKPGEINRVSGLLFSRLPINYQILTQSNNTLRARFDNDAGGEKKIDTTSTIEVGKWYHAAASFNPTTGKCRIYFNAVLEKEDDLAGVLDNQNQDVKIGAINISPDSKHFIGTIDEVCIYNRVLSAAEIATRYKFATTKI